MFYIIHCCLCYSIITVPLYTTRGHATHMQLNDAPNTLSYGTVHRSWDRKPALTSNHICDIHYLWLVSGFLKAGPTKTAWLAWLCWTCVSVHPYVTRVFSDVCLNSINFLVKHLWYNLIFVQLLEHCIMKYFLTDRKRGLDFQCIQIISWRQVAMYDHKFPVYHRVMWSPPRLNSWTSIHLSMLLWG